MGQVNSTLTLLAVRERLMEYFKHDCVERLVDGRASWREEPQPSLQYQYQRQEYDRQQPRTLVLDDGVKLFKARKEPELITFLNPRGFETLTAQVQDFLSKYLPHVPVTSDKGKKASSSSNALTYAQMREAVEALRDNDAPQPRINRWGLEQVNAMQQFYVDTQMRAPAPWTSGTLTWTEESITEVNPTSFPDTEEDLPF